MRSGMLRERGSLSRLDSRRGRGDGLGEKLRDCAHFSQHTILYIKLLEEEIQCFHTDCNELLINFCFNMTISLGIEVHPAIIGCLLLKWHSAIGNIIQLNTILRWSRVFRPQRCQHGKWCQSGLAEAVWVCSDNRHHIIDQIHPNVYHL